MAASSKKQKLSATIASASQLEAVIRQAVASCEVIDVHTHLFPPSHEPLMLWGIDELLTYHYLVAEFFMTAPGTLKPDAFFALAKGEQAAMVWQALFVDRLPVSEAARGVVTVLHAFGLDDALQARDLESIRAWFAAQDVEEHVERVFKLAGVRYAVMTNIPFAEEEAFHWRPKKTPYSARFRSALRVDPLLKGDWPVVLKALAASEYPASAEGARNFLRGWVDTMKPDYLMASTPHDFHVAEDPLAGFLGCSCGTAAAPRDLSQPGAFGIAAHQVQCASMEISSEPQGTELLEKVLIPVAQERCLPIAIKVGAHREVNPSLRGGGDGVVNADISDLRRLLVRYPDVKFLVTFLSRENQHEACVLANKFRNLHLYGCWWYCNNPSLIKEITSMRTEMLGFAFTAQHSDSRVLEQLIYKWTHSRRIIADVIVANLLRLFESGWLLTEEEVRRDVRRLLGGSYEEFMAK